jgi:hypothetical protein
MLQLETGPPGRVGVIDVLTDASLLMLLGIVRAAGVLDLSEVREADTEAGCRAGPLTGRQLDGGVSPLDASRRRRQARFPRRPAGPGGASRPRSSRRRFR